MAETASSSSSGAANEPNPEIALKTVILLHMAERVALEMKKICITFLRDEQHFNDLEVVYAYELIRQQSRLKGLDNGRARCVSQIEC